MTTSVQAAAKTVWWMILVRGVLAVILGLIALFSPGIALLSLVYVFAFYALLDGVMAIVAGIRWRASMPHWGWVIVQGVVSVLAGIVALVWPGLTVLTLLLVIGFWAIVLGITQIVEAFRSRKLGASWWGWTLAAGILGVLFGIALLMQPGAGILALLWVLATFALASGIVQIILAFRVRSLARSAG